MSQMKPYCFKCGAELDPDAIYCPECGRLQRSMVVRTGDPDPSTPGPPPTTYSGASHDQPYHFYPDRDAPAAEQAGPAEQHPDQQDPYAQQQYSEHDWRGGPPTDGYGEQAPYTEAGGDQVYARQDYDQQQSWSETGYGQHDANGYGGQPAYGQDPAQGQEPAHGQEPAYGE